MHSPEHMVYGTCTAHTHTHKAYVHREYMYVCIHTYRSIYVWHTYSTHTHIHTHAAWNIWYSVHSTNAQHVHIYAQRGAYGIQYTQRTRVHIHTAWSTWYSVRAQRTRIHVQQRAYGTENTRTYVYTQTAEYTRMAHIQHTCTHTEPGSRPLTRALAHLSPYPHTLPSPPHTPTTSPTFSTARLPYHLTCAKPNSEAENSYSERQVSV